LIVVILLFLTTILSSFSTLADCPVFRVHYRLSSFNRQLCLILAAQGHEVCCLLPSCSSEERESAIGAGVTLVETMESVGVKEIDRLNLQPNLPNGFVPDLIIGHDRITGPSMTVLRREFYRSSKTVLFIHTSPGEIEWYKPIEGDKSITQKADERERIQLGLAKECDLVVTVGQKLFNEMSTQLAGLEKHPKIIQFTPSLFDFPISEKEVSPIPFCLLLGRVEDFELKGVDIATKALDEAYKNLTGEKPVFIIRGAVAGTGDELQKKVRELCSSPLEVRVKEYSPNEELLREDIRRASIVLMPSRSEGFGLVGLEAISLYCPILISDNSGLAKLIETISPDDAHYWIVKNNNTQELAKNIEFILKDRNATNARIKKLAESIKSQLSWENAVEILINSSFLDANN
jgi:glycosyltransferase involved in cell wall biosynthesis